MPLKDDIWDEKPWLYDPYDEDERPRIKRCPSCGSKMKYGTCWSCHSKDSGAPCDPQLLPPHLLKIIEEKLRRERKR